ncbi:MAG: tyrosine-protein phosphatase [Anaerolineae bacterium]|nr:tyrosine-protein phosphatase [Anaerolineae bacterium]
MGDGIIIGLASILLGLIGIGLLWFIAVRVIGRGVPFIEPQTFIRHLEASDSPETKDLRHIPLQGAANFRDLGGYRTGDGRRIKWRLIYRSEALGRLTPADLAYLSDLGLRTIYDLRTPSEIARVPDRIPETAQWIAMPAQDGDFDKKYITTLLFNRKIIPAQMAMSYPQQLVKNARRFGAILSHFANPNNLPAVFHCTAGKDRAGLTAALLLGALGVPEQTIIADYTLSNLAYEKLFAIFLENNRTSLGYFGIPMKELYPMFIADPAWMEGALTFIKQNYGSFHAYLLGPAEMDAVVLNQLRKNLLE